MTRALSIPEKVSSGDSFAGMAKAPEQEDIRKAPSSMETKMFFALESCVFNKSIYLSVLLFKYKNK
jgi:hypothetical protein